MFIVHSSPKKGYKLGTASATWKKIKSATYSSNDKSVDSADVIIRSDDQGNILIYYPSTNVLEMWDWDCPDSTKDINDNDTLYLLNQRSIPMEEGWRMINFIFANTDTIVFHFESADDVKFSSFSLTHLKCIQELKAPAILKVKTKVKSKNPPSPGVPESLASKERQLPEYQIKSNGDYVIITNSEGYLVIFEFDGRNYKLKPILPKIFKESCQPLINKYEFDNMDSMVLRTSTFDKKAIFDIVGNWLVYSPTKCEYQHLKSLFEAKLANGVFNADDLLASSGSSTNSNLSSKSSPSPSNDKTTKISSGKRKFKQSFKRKRPQLLTQVKLPPPGPLLNRVISTLSNTALDGICKFSELSSQVVKSYFDKEKEKENKEMDKNSPTFNDITRAITKTIYSTAASTISSGPGDNQLIKVIDLKNDKVMGIFKPPGGVSNLSLSPYDLQLIHSNLRGDLFFMWDLYKLPLEVSLIGKFTRGKTSAKIKDIFWFINNTNSSTIKGNNYGFGCITKSSGSIHWFNINYLSGNLNSNFPNVLGQHYRSRKSGKSKAISTSTAASISRVGSVESSADSAGVNNGGVGSHRGAIDGKGSYTEFSDDWILSSMQATKFITLPNKSNSMNTGVSASRINQLAILDSKNQLRLISPLNGTSLFKYQLPFVQVNKEHAPTFVKARESSKQESTDPHINPLSRTEIETCAPYPNLYRNKNIEFSTYDYSEGDDLDNFLISFETFGNEVTNKVIKFNKEEAPNTVFEDIKRRSIILDQEEGEEEIGPDTDSSTKFATADFEANNAELSKETSEESV
ncbi:hypothetical protein CLIB1423_02S08636 [[Candida] railenensis]|uniref:Uncharacterized protein n=1 Tax=[Candida] railenensis TaxID=45579 RepID=A0A9P0VW70_9ASCO|nr:hypothetical protein CLIB1423_02S08636 [[Candida] railenensis]